MLRVKSPDAFIMQQEFTTVPPMGNLSNHLHKGSFYFDRLLPCSESKYSYKIIFFIWISLFKGGVIISKRQTVTVISSAKEMNHLGVTTYHMPHVTA